MVCSSDSAVTSAELLAPPLGWGRRTHRHERALQASPTPGDPHGTTPPRRDDHAHRRLPAAQHASKESVKKKQQQQTAKTDRVSQPGAVSRVAFVEPRRQGPSSLAAFRQCHSPPSAV